MRMLSLLFSTALLSAGVAGAQTGAGGTILGSVRDADTEEPIIGAVVEATSISLMGKESFRTDSLGQYTLTFLPPGKYRVTVHGPKQRSIQDNVLVNMGATLHVFFRLGEPGTLLVANEDNGALSFFDLYDKKAFSSVPVAEGTRAVAVSPNRRRALVGGENALGLVDLSRALLERTIALKKQRVLGVAFRDEQGAVAVTDQKAVLMVDLQEGAAERAISLGAKAAGPIAILPDGSRALVPLPEPGALAVVDLKEGKLLPQIPTAAGAEDVAIAPDGGEIWVANRDAGTLSVLKAKTLEIAATIACSSDPFQLRFTPDGKQVLVANAGNGGDLAVFDVATRKELRRFRLAGRPAAILVRPDGRFAYGATENHLIAMIDVARWQPVRFFRAGKGPRGLAWSELRPKAK
jgi:YVTN family beta-propeller protein